MKLLLLRRRKLMAGQSMEGTLPDNMLLEKSAIYSRC